MEPRAFLKASGGRYQSKSLSSAASDRHGLWRSLASLRCFRKREQAGLFEESLAITLGDPWGISHSLSRLAFVLLKLHDRGNSRRLVAESIEIQQETGDRPGLVFNLEVCAELAAAEARQARAARLYACASVLRETVGSHPVEVGWPDHEGEVDRLRSTLDEETFGEAWAEGLAMSTDEALAYALEVEDR